MNNHIEIITDITKACMDGDHELLSNLMDMCPIETLTKRGRFGMTIPHRMAQGTSLNPIDCLKVLVSKGIPVDIRNFKGMTPLMCAAENGYIDIANALIDMGADINAMDNIGSTPAIFAADLYYNLDMIVFLAKKGADLSIKNKKGESAQSLCMERSNSDEGVRNMLLEITMNSTSSIIDQNENSGEIVSTRSQRRISL